ncbi:MAG: alpha/beta fold hydrolase [Bacteroidota bacterium]
MPTDSHPTLIMLHGRGADENDLFGFSRDLDNRLSIYSLRAPFEYEWGGYTWFNLFDDGTVDEASFDYSRNQILEFLSSLRSQKIFLFGFSMGAILSYALALTDPQRYSGIACLSGFAPLQLEKHYKLTDMHDLQIFISHGVNDPVIPISSARTTKHLLESSSARLHYHEYPMGHEISPQCFEDVNTWISSLL